MALIGQGPDELFGGYKRHLGVQYGGHWRQLPRLAAEAAWTPASAACRATRRSSAACTRSTSKIGCSAIRTCSRSCRATTSMACSATACCPRRGRQHLEFWRDLAPEMDGATSSERSRCWRSAPRCRTNCSCTRTSSRWRMASRCECPTSTRRWSSSRERLPARFKVRHGQRKWLHRRVCEAFLPPDDPGAQEARLRGQRGR